MIPIYHQSAYAWSQGNPRKSFSLLDDYLKSDLAEDVFSIDDDFFDKADQSYSQFLQRLTNNDHRRNAFCSTFASLWKDFPSHSVLRLLMVKNFAEPSMVKAYGMENFGFKDPEENFEMILAAFRKSAHEGFLTSLPAPPAFDGRVHLDFEHLKEFLDEARWLHYKSLLLNFEKELNGIGEVPWNKAVASNHQLVLSVFLHQAFGEFNRKPAENLAITTASLESNPKWKHAISGSAEKVLQESSDEALTGLVKCTCGIHSNELNGRVWLQTYLDYATDFRAETFYRLYR